MIVRFLKVSLIQRQKNHNNTFYYSMKNENVINPIYAIGYAK
jgi:hypothetical protein